MIHELGVVDHLTCDAIGPPGERVFYFQARSSGQTESTTVIVEKQQAQLLAASIFGILAQVERPTGELDLEMSLLEPFEPLWRAGRASISYEEDDDRIAIEIEELVPEDADGVALDEEAGAVRLFASRELALCFAKQATEVAERGRPTCQYCGEPIDPEGHACPATNGHKKPTPPR